MKQYGVNVKIFQVDKNEETYEEEIVIGINTFKLNCFISDYLTEGDFVKGEMTEIQLSLMTTELDIINCGEKNIVSTEHFEAHCRLSGEIKEFFPIIYKYYKDGIWYDEEATGYKHGIVDCGIFVAVQIPKKSDLKIGDYVKAEGRLDARKVKKEN
ncbi:hypothetical protein [Methanosarcina sp. 2.H.A.1B.4]|uniref:hypothetical protein n=1 Tax=Methanosarcina sp. 2.H.A.1B.4 TaxID=1483600 RepID=UPI00062216EA|nr:hypothetical protein [Methanosarcina sp. 2.H.A.1B.4]KKG08948.1 hypothetical protein EO92_00195 [Methanosarcina sp. 2.H.A.1B.4]